MAAGSTVLQKFSKMCAANDCVAVTGHSAGRLSAMPENIAVTAPAHGERRGTPGAAANHPEVSQGWHRRQDHTPAWREADNFLHK